MAELSLYIDIDQDRFSKNGNPAPIAPASAGKGWDHGKYIALSADELEQFFDIVRSLPTDDGQPIAIKQTSLLYIPSSTTGHETHYLLHTNDPAVQLVIKKIQADRGSAPAVDADGDADADAAGALMADLRVTLAAIAAARTADPDPAAAPRVPTAADHLLTSLQEHGAYVDVELREAPFGRRYEATVTGLPVLIERQINETAAAATGQGVSSRSASRPASVSDSAPGDLNAGGPGGGSHHSPTPTPHSAADDAATGGNGGGSGTAAEAPKTRFTIEPNDNTREIITSLNGKFNVQTDQIPDSYARAASILIEQGQEADNLSSYEATISLLLSAANSLRGIPTDPKYHYSEGTINIVGDDGNTIKQVYPFTSQKMATTAANRVDSGVDPLTGQAPGSASASSEGEDSADEEEDATAAAAAEAQSFHKLMRMAGELSAAEGADLQTAIDTHNTNFPDSEEVTIEKVKQALQNYKERALTASREALVIAKVVKVPNIANLVKIHNRNHQDDISTGDVTEATRQFEFIRIRDMFEFLGELGEADEAKYDTLGRIAHAIGEYNGNFPGQDLSIQKASEAYYQHQRTQESATLSAEQKKEASKQALLARIREIQPGERRADRIEGLEIHNHEHKDHLDGQALLKEVAAAEAKEEQYEQEKQEAYQAVIDHIIAKLNDASGASHKAAAKQLGEFNSRFNEEHTYRDAITAAQAQYRATKEEELAQQFATAKPRAKKKIASQATKLGLYPKNNNDLSKGFQTYEELLAQLTEAHSEEDDPNEAILDELVGTYDAPEPDDKEVQNLVFSDQYYADKIAVKEELVKAAMTAGGGEHDPEEDERTEDDDASAYDAASYEPEDLYEGLTDAQRAAVAKDAFGIARPAFVRPIATTKIPDYYDTFGYLHGVDLDGGRSRRSSSASLMPMAAQSGDEDMTASVSGGSTTGSQGESSEATDDVLNRTTLDEGDIDTSSPSRHSQLMDMMFGNEEHGCDHLTMSELFPGIQRSHYHRSKINPAKTTWGSIKNNQITGSVLKDIVDHVRTAGLDPTIAAAILENHIASLQTRMSKYLQQLDTYRQALSTDPSNPSLQEEQETLEQTSYEITEATDDFIDTFGIQLDEAGSGSNVLPARLHNLRKLQGFIEAIKSHTRTKFRFGKADPLSYQAFSAMLTWRLKDAANFQVALHGNNELAEKEGMLALEDELKDRIKELKEQKETIKAERDKLIKEFNQEVHDELAPPPAPTDGDDGEEEVAAEEEEEDEESAAAEEEEEEAAVAHAQETALSALNSQLLEQTQRYNVLANEIAALEEVLKQPAEDLGKNQGDAGDLAEELEDIKVTIGNKLKRLISMADRRTAKGKPVEQRTEEEEAQLDQLARIKAFADLDKDEIVRQLEQDYLAGGDEAAADDAHEGEEKAAVAVADEAADGDEAAADGPAVGGDEEPAPTMLQTILSMGEGTEFNSDLRSFKRGITNALEDIRDLRERHNKKQNPIALGIARTEAIQRRIGQRIAEQKNIQETQLTAATKAYQAKIDAAAQNVDHLHVEMFDTYGSDRRKTIGTLHKAVTKTKTTVEQNQALTLAFRSALRSLYKFRTRAMQKADRDLRTAAPDQQGTAFLMRVHKKVERDVQSYAQEILNTTANYIAAWNRRHADDAEPDHDTKMKLATLVRAVDPNRKILADVPMKGMPNLDDMLKLMQNINYVINNGRSSKSGYKPTTYHQAIKFISAHGPCSTEASYAAKCSSEYNEFVVAQRRSQAISHELNQDNQAIRQYTAGPGAAAAAKRLAHQHLVEMGLLERGPADASSTKGLATEVAKLARLANMQAEKLLHADQKVVTMSARTRHQACRQPHRSSRLTHSALHIHSRRSTGAHSSSTPGGSPASHRRGRATSPGEAATEGRRRNRKSKHLLGRGHEPKPSGGSVELTDFSGDASIRGPGSE